jgi:uncharacterized protein
VRLRETDHVDGYAVARISQIGRARFVFPFPTPFPGLRLNENRSQMIIEGLLTCADGDQPHVSAIGPVVDPALTQWTLRPYMESRMFHCLRAHPQCVFHVTDDVEPVMRLVLGQSAGLATQRLQERTWILPAACRWYRLEIQEWELDPPRSAARAVVLDQGELRPFWGWNRAKHALLEAAILISRVRLIPADELRRELTALRQPVLKTAGPAELAAWEAVELWIEHTLPNQPET